MDARAQAYGGESAARDQRCTACLEPEEDRGPASCVSGTALVLPLERTPTREHLLVSVPLVLDLTPQQASHEADEQVMRDARRGRTRIDAIVLVTHASLIAWSSACARLLRTLSQASTCARSVSS